MGTRIRITNNSKQPQDIGGRWVQPGASDVFDADQVAPEWRAGAVVVESDDPRAGELEREGDRLYVRKADGSRNSLVEAGIGPGGGNRFLVGSRSLDFAAMDGRWRQIDAGVTPGELLTNFGPGGIATAVAVTLGGGSAPAWAYRRDVVTLPDGRTVPSLWSSTPFNRQTLVDITFPPRVIADTDVIEVQIFIPEAYLGLQSRVHLTADGMATYLTGNPEFESKTTLKNTASGFVTLRIPRSRMTATGVVAADAQINQVRVEVRNDTVPHDGVVMLLGVSINRRELPKIVFTADDGFASDLWLADELGKRGLRFTSYIVTDYRDNPPAAGYMTWDQVRDLALRNNVQIGSHSHKHFAVNGRISAAEMYGASSDAIAQSQSIAAGAVSLNGSVGAAAFDRPRHVTISCSGANVAIYWDVVGEYRGKAVSERIYAYTTDASPRPTRSIFDKITSITCDLNGRSALGSVRFGTSMAYDEIYYDVERSFLELESRGLSSPLDRHFCAPYGMTNDTLFQVLQDLSVKTCRATKQHLTAFGQSCDFYTIPSAQWDSTNYTNKPEQLQWVIEGGASFVVYTHEVLDSGAGAGKANKEQLVPFMDAVGALVASGQAASPTMSELFQQSRPSGPARIAQALTTPYSL